MLWPLCGALLAILGAAGRVGAAVPEPDQDPRDGGGGPLEPWRQFVEGQGARAPGLPGNAALQAAVERRFKESGFENGVLLFEAPVFVPGQTQLRMEDGQTYRLMPLHPTLMRPGNFEAAEFEAALVYLGKGQVADLKRAHGLKLDGGIAVMEFACGDRWLDLLRFGLRGFIFLPAETYAHADAVAKVYNSEVSTPRFLASEEAAAALRARFAERPETRGTVISKPSLWRNQTLGSPWVLAPGADAEAGRDVLLLTAPLDANSVVPEMAYGGDTAGNLMLLLDLLDRWREHPPRCSVLLVAVNAHTQAYLGERMLAWHLLQAQEDVTRLRDDLAVEMRTISLYVNQYGKLRFDPVSLTPEQVGDAVRVLWALDEQDPKGDLKTLDKAVLKAAVERAIATITERGRSFFARMFMSDAARAEAAKTCARLAALRDGDAEALRGVLVAVQPTFMDEKLLEDWRTATDASSGMRLPIKGPLQERVKRELNVAKVGQMDLAAEGVKEGAESVALRERRAALTRVLTLFNKIDIGYSVERVQYRQIAANAGDRALLMGFRDDLVKEMKQREELFRRRLEMDTACGALRGTLGTRAVRLAVTLDMDWSAERAGFMALNQVSTEEWYRNFGNLAVAVSGKVDPPAGKEGRPYVDTLSVAIGEPQEGFFIGHRSPAGLFHAAGGVPSLALRAVNTAPCRAFTPRNRVADLDGEATLARFKWIGSYMAALVAEPGLTDQKRLDQPWPARLWSCLVKTCQMDEFAAKPTPSLTVPNALVAAYSPKSAAATLPFIVDGQVAPVCGALGDATGFAVLYALPEGRLIPDAYRLDEERQAVVLSVIDKGRIQQSQQMDSTLDRTTSKTLPMFSAREMVIGDRIDPSRVGSRPVRVDEFWVFSGKSSAAPQKYGIQGAGSLSRALTHDAAGPVGIYQEYKTRKKTGEPLLMMTDSRRFAVQATDREPEGRGFAAPADLQRDFFRQTARDMHRVTRRRLGAMKGVVNELIDEFLARGEAAIKSADEAAAAGNHIEIRRQIAVAVGNLSKAYDQIRNMNADMLKAIMIYMALMLPFCYFLQKLIFSFTRIEHEMMAFSVLFLVIYGVFRVIHPAFSIAMSPEAIFLAFVLGAIGVFVTWMLHSRFSGEMELLFRGASGFAAEAATAFVGQTAMIIGVNNMKRRRTRTTLTTATIVLVVFTMLAFSSVSRKARPTLILKSESAPYTGLFFTWPGQAPMDEDSLRVFEALYAERGELLARRVLSPGKTPAKIPVRWTLERADKIAAPVAVTALLSLSPQESRFAGPMPFASGGHFTDERAEEIVLPDLLASALGMGKADVGSAQVRLLGHRLKVVGIIDSDRYRRMRDLNPDVALMPPSAVGEKKAEGVSAAVDETAVLQGLSTLVFLPGGLLADLGGKPYSISLRLDDAKESDSVAALWEEADTLLRTSDALFTMGSIKPFKVGKEARRPTEAGVYQVVGAYRTTIGGLARLLVPLLIAGLILFNTMLSTVYERKAEIAIYNAIGLNPRHIFIFFLAEALVYGIIGAIGGYLIGQVLALTAQKFDLVSGMNVNFSSLMVVWAIMFTVGLVLLSTLYPAWVAVRTAVPSGTRRWGLPEHDGRRMQVDLPFIYEPDLAIGVMAYLHEIFSSCVEDSMSEMLVAPRSLSGKELAEGHPVLRAEYGVALAPYDLGVTQSMAIQARYVPKLESYEMSLDIRRESGQDSSWATVNQPMLERLRKALLRWRNMDPGRHREYVDMGRKLFGE